jgi:hypothetical protein
MDTCLRRYDNFSGGRISANIVGSDIDVLSMCMKNIFERLTIN